MMIKKEEYDRILEDLKKLSNSFFEPVTEHRMSVLENKAVFLVRSVREGTFKEVLHEISELAPKCKLYVLGRRGDEEILKQNFQGNYRLFTADDDKKYDVSQLQRINNEINSVKFDAAFFMTQDSVGFNQKNLMDILYEIPCEMRGVITNQRRLLEMPSLAEWRRYESLRTEYDSMCDEIWEFSQKGGL